MSEPTIPASKSKIAYIDYLKVILTILVIVHHAAVTYGAPGGWYYSEKTTLLGVSLALTTLVAINQSFFMGFFFFLSALFIPSSHDKKGPVKFITDRLVRLGLPLFFYSFILSPFLSFIPYNYTGTHPKITYLQYLGGFDSWISFGVLWFVAALLIFTLLYVLFRLIIKKYELNLPAPTSTQILLAAGVIGLVSYVVRLFFPVGWVLEPLGFQLGHFPQYIAMFVLGLIASRSKWLEKMELKTGKQMRRTATYLVAIGFPLFFVAQQLLNFPVSEFNIGGHWPSLWYALWEQLTGFSIAAALLIIGRSRLNNPGAWVTSISRTTFAMYIFHPLVLIALSVALHNLAIEPGLKFLIVAPLAVIGTFLLAKLLVKVPGLKKII